MRATQDYAVPLYVAVVSASDRGAPVMVNDINLYLYKYENVCLSVCLFVCLFTFFSVISKPIGKHFTIQLLIDPE